MSIAKYILKEATPCADYGKLTVEGKFEIMDNKKFHKKIYELIPDISNINSGQILIGKTNDFDIYIYDNEKFVMSKLENEHKAICFLNNLVK